MEPRPEKKPSSGKTPGQRRGKPGFLVVGSQPAGARIYVDNKFTGRVTPVAPSNPLSLSPGWHRVHLVVDGKSFRFSLVIRSGKMSKLVKKLNVNR